MPSVIQEIQNELTETTVEELSRDLNADYSRVSVAISTALPMLINALARFSEDYSEFPERAILNTKNLALLLDSFNSETLEISAIEVMKLLYGERLSSLESRISATSGLPSQTVFGLLEILLPIVLRGVSKVRLKENLNDASLAQMIVKESQHARQLSPQVTGILDQFHGPAPKTQLPKDPYLGSPTKKNNIFDI